MAHPILVVGTVALDNVQTPFGKVKDALGGSAVYFSYSACKLAPVRLVGAVGKDFPKKHVGLLRRQKIDVSGLEYVDGSKTFRWSGKFEDDLNEAITLDTKLNVLAEFAPKVPDDFRDTPIVFLANLDPDLQLDILSQMKKPKLVLADTMNLWIDIKLPALKKLMKKIDVLTINEGEARLLTGELNLAACARKLLTMGPGRVIIKRGEYGATMFTKKDFFALPAYPLEMIKDPTGAGDTFAGGLVGELAKQGKFTEKAFRQALVRGSVHASFVVEGFSLDGMKRADAAKRRKRYNDFVRFTRI